VSLRSSSRLFSSPTCSGTHRTAKTGPQDLTFASIVDCKRRILSSLRTANRLPHPILPRKTTLKMPRKTCSPSSQNISLAFLQRSRAGLTPREAREADRVICAYLSLLSRYKSTLPAVLFRFRHIFNHIPYALIPGSKFTLNTHHHLTNLTSNLAAIITLPETDQ
jgi:hypothetical protein